MYKKCSASDATASQLLWHASRVFTNPGVHSRPSRRSNYWRGVLLNAPLIFQLLLFQELPAPVFIAPEA
jgi:hypothetical protein